MLANILKSRLKIVEKGAELGPLGERVTYEVAETRYGRVIPLDARARVMYQQLNSEVTHVVIFRGNVILNLGKHLIKDSAKTYRPIEPPIMRDNSTIIGVKEIE